LRRLGWNIADWKVRLSGADLPLKAFTAVFPALHIVQRYAQPDVHHL
jgi:hypothetical protein